MQQLYAFSMKDLVEIHKDMTVAVQKKRHIQVIILATCWGIWKVKNETIFGGNGSTLTVFGDAGYNFFMAQEQGEKEYFGVE
ncbi:hypothetical protein HanIR_Chr17g0902131 [Helianthus annuus]|nr:hypothetical protein HanIR_Chr17g0902131 [Helianthus annuus]